MELNLNLTMDENGELEREKLLRVKQAELKKSLKTYQPTHDELWFTGYETHTGKHKPGIYQTKLTDSDRRKLDAVRVAIEQNELGLGVDDRKKFTKSHALRLYLSLVEINREKTIKHMLENRPKNYILVQDENQLSKLCDKLARETLISVDTETTGLNIFGVDGTPQSEIVGIVISLDSYNLHYYVPFGHLTDEKQLPKHLVVEALRPFIEDPTLKKVLHNSKYDIHMFYNLGLFLQGFHFDTMVGFHLLNENEQSFALKNLANKYGQYFGYEDKSASYEELFGKGGFETARIDIGSIYAAKDGELTLKLYHFIQSQFDRLPELRKYYEEIEREITLVSVEMERNGFEVDFSYAEKYAAELEKDLFALESELKRHFGEINVNSPAQLSEVLYDKLGLPDVSKKRSTDANTLKKLAKQHEGCEILLKYRDLMKLLSTYIKPLPEKVGKDGRLHGEFKQSSTVTGRFSSSNPNLQNLPKKARKIIVAGRSKVIIGIDFSQIEPRCLSSMSGDKKFQEPYITGRDLYSEIASRVFGVPIEECGDGSIYRKRSKIILLAVMYGMSPHALSEMLKISLQEGEKFVDDFFTSYEGVTAFIEDTHNQADEIGYVTTLFGRKRRFIGHVEIAKAYKNVCEWIEKNYGEVPKNIWQSDLPYDVKQKYWKYAGEYNRNRRMAGNFRIQGSAAEIMKIAMIKLWKHCLNKGYKFLATIHDEVLIETPDTITLEEVEELENIMASAVKIDVDIRCDVEMSRRWGEGISKDEWFQGGNLG